LANVNNTGTLSITTHANTTIDGITDADYALLKVGQYITATGIEMDTVIVSKDGGATNAKAITVSKATTANATVTATWYTMYELILLGNFVASANWFKPGFNINAGSSEIVWGNFTLLSKTASAPIPYYIRGGSWFGNHASSIFFASLTTADASDYSLKPNYVYSIGIGTQIQCTTYQAFRNFVVDCARFDARFGTIANFEGDSASTTKGTVYWSGYKYGLLGGVTITRGKLISSGELQTPANVNALSSAGYISEFYVSDYITGQINMVGYCGGSFTGAINGATHNIYVKGTTGATPFLFNCTFIGTTINLTGDGNIQFKGYTEATINNAMTTGGCATFHNFKGIYNGSASSDAKINSAQQTNAFGLYTVALTGTAKLTVNDGFKYSGGGTSCLVSLASGTEMVNEGYFKLRMASFASGSTFTNKGDLKMYFDSAYVLSGTLNASYSNIELISTSSAPCIRIDATGWYNQRGGKLYCNDATSKAGLLMKTANGSKVTLSGEAYLKVTNGLAPIQITSNTGTAPDIEVFSVIDNCAVGYRLLDTFTDATYGPNYAPNDTVGGFKRENTAYVY
jgi:hypothetical protein